VFKAGRVSAHRWLGRREVRSRKEIEVAYRPQDPLESLRTNFSRLFDELAGARPVRGGASEDEPQSVPVNVFETENEVVLVAPMPGLEAENLDIRFEDRYLTIRGEKRGPGQERHRYLRREWSYGPYERTIELPVDVDADKANATYSNGLLTVALPKAPHRRTRRIEISLEPVGTARGEHVGHRGTAEAGGGTTRD
jgi:HSP20 family protein